MAFEIHEKQEYMGLPITSVYVRLHIQISIKGQVIVKPIFYITKKAYEANSEGYMRNWVVPVKTKVVVTKEVEGKIKKSTQKREEQKDICTLYLALGQVESYKKLIPEVTKEVIDELLEAGFIYNKKAVKQLK